MLAYKLFKSCFILFSFILLQTSFAMDARKKARIKPSSQVDKKSKTEKSNVAVLLASYSTRVNNWMFLFAQPKNSEQYTAFFGNAMPSEATEHMLARIVNTQTYGVCSQATIMQSAASRIKRSIAAGQMGYIIPVAEINLSDLINAADKHGQNPIANYMWLDWNSIKNMVEHPEGYGGAFEPTILRYIYDNFATIIEPHLKASPIAKHFFLAPSEPTTSLPGSKLATDSISTSALEAKPKAPSKSKKLNPRAIEFDPHAKKIKQNLHGTQTQDKKENAEKATFALNRAFDIPFTSHRWKKISIMDAQHYIDQGADIHAKVITHSHYEVNILTRIVHAMHCAPESFDDLFPLFKFFISQGAKVDDTALKEALQFLPISVLRELLGHCSSHDIGEAFRGIWRIDKEKWQLLLQTIKQRALAGDKIDFPFDKLMWQILIAEHLQDFIEYLAEFELDFIKNNPLILHKIIERALSEARRAIKPLTGDYKKDTEIATYKSNFDASLLLIARLIDIGANPILEDAEGKSAFDLVPYQGPTKEYAYRIWQVLNKKGYVEGFLKAVDDGTSKKLFGPIADLIGQLAVNKHDEILELIDTAAAKKISEETIIKKLKTKFENGYSKNSCNNNHKSLLMYACQRGLIKLIRFLLEQPEVDSESDESIRQTKVDIDARDLSGMNALMYAAEAGHAHVIDLLIEHAMRTFDSKIAGAKIRAMINAQTKNFQHIKKRIIRGAPSGPKTGRYRLHEDGSVDLESVPEGTTALMFAINRCDIQVVATLLKYKADIMLQDSEHRTAYAYAVASQHHEILRLLDGYRG